MSRWDDDAARISEIRELARKTGAKLQADAEALKQIIKSPCNHGDTRWAAYQNQALDSASLGHIQFLAVGPKNTLKEPPKRCPDTHLGLGWKYQFFGWLDLETGEINETE
jgi:hypothetical protein